MRILLSSLLLISLVGRGQLINPKEGDRWSTRLDDPRLLVWHTWHNGKELTDTVQPAGQIDFMQLHYTLPGMTTEGQPRTATAWASLQNEVNELKKEVETLKIFEKHDWNQIEMEVVVREFLEAQVDSLIKALRERDKPPYPFPNGDFKILPMSNYQMPAASDPIGLTITVDTTKWMRRPVKRKP